jgi:hypothetical protein
VRTIGRVTTSAAIAAAVGLIATACSSGSSTSSASAGTKTGCAAGMQAGGVAAPPGYQVCLWVAATTTANHPDNVVIAGSNVFIGWQNITAKDGTDTKTSTIAEYTTSGKLLKSWSVIGHTDGMRMDPSTHLLWVMCDEDGNPRLYTINPASGAPTTITLPPAPWGGGFDDVQFANGLALIDASNPALNAAGKNIYTALYSVKLNGTKAVLTKVLAAQASATTISTPSTTVKLNLTDPDSMMIDPNGTLVLDSQGDGEMLWITNVGAANQSVSVLSVGTQIDDTVWPSTSKGCILVADNASGVYSICSALWVPGTAYSASPNDSTVAGFIGSLNLSSGTLIPLVVGIANPHGMAFLPR